MPQQLDLFVIILYYLVLALCTYFCVPVARLGA
jgi:hypothetical protein